MTVPIYSPLPDGRLFSDNDRFLEPTPHLYFADPKPMLICHHVERFIANPTFDFYRAVRIQEKIAVDKVHWVTPEQIVQNHGHFAGHAPRHNFGLPPRAKENIDTRMDYKILAPGTLLLQAIKNNEWYALEPQQQFGQNLLRAEYHADRGGVHLTPEQRGPVCQMFNFHAFGEDVVGKKMWRDQKQLHAHGHDITQMRNFGITL